MRHEADGWGPGPSILASDTLAELRSTLEDTPLIVEHWFYRGARAPDRHIFEDCEALETYLRERTSAGDAIYAWRFDQVCHHDSAIASGKVPDVDGTVPARGAY